MITYCRMKVTAKTKKVRTMREKMVKRKLMPQPRPLVKLKPNLVKLKTQTRMTVRIQVAMMTLAWLTRKMLPRTNLWIR